MSPEQRETLASVRDLLSTAPLEELPSLILEYSTDERVGVISAIATAQRRIAQHDRRLRRLEELQLHEKPLWSAGFEMIAGVDEVGRGALAGPLVAAAVSLDKNTDELLDIDDSKVMTAETRDVAFETIHRVAKAVSVCIISHSDIDRFGIGVANDMALSRAVADLDPSPDYLLSDAFKVDTEIPSMSIIKGDSKSIAIASASVVAKVTRDRIMVQLDSEYPGFGLASNKGYGSKDHMEALASSGPSGIHRISFSPSGGSQLTLEL